MINLVKRYNKILKKPPRKYNPRAKVSFSPNSLGTPCLRKCYYQFTKSPEERGFPLKVARILSLGNLIGDHLADTFRKDGILVDYHNPDGTIPVVFGKECREFPINAPTLDIHSGFIDGVFICEGRLYIGEFKSINDNQFSNLREPKPEHLIQGVTYLHLFNKKLKNGDYSHITQLDGFDKAEGVVFLYYCKDNSFLKEFFVSDTAEIFKQVVQRIVYIQNIVYVQNIDENTELPEKTEYFCDSCAYQKRCSLDMKAPRHGGLVTCQ